MVRMKPSAHKRGRIRNRAVAPLDAIQRGEIVEGIVDNLRPWKNHKSRDALSRDVDHVIDLLRKLVPAQNKQFDQQPFREYRKKLDKALSDVEKVMASAPQFRRVLFSETWPAGTSFAPFGSMSGESFAQLFRDPPRAKAFDAELKRLRGVCARDIGLHPNVDIAKRLSAEFAHGLMAMRSDHKISGTANKGFRIITMLLYEAVSGEKDADLKRACDSAIIASYPYLASELGTNESR